MNRVKTFICIALFSINSFANDNNFLDEFQDEYKQVEEVYDPLYKYNSVMTQFNDGFYKNILIPTAKGYDYIVNDNIKIGINNAFENIFFPIRFANNLLQLKFKNAGEETLRFILNSTFGLFGLIDVGAKIGLKQRDEDFGQTLGYYGIGAGPHIVLPFLGPSNLRDSIGLVGNLYLNPLSNYSQDTAYKIVNNGWESFGVEVFRRLNESSLEPNAYENLTKDAVDLYPFLRDVYEQRREALIKE